MIPSRELEDKKFFENKKFGDVYNQIIYYLQEARKVLLEHPLTWYPEDSVNALFYGLLTIVVVSKIEFILEKWQDYIIEFQDLLKIYFDNKTSNGKKVEALYSFFKKFKPDVERKIFDDYLAIKYLRNTIVHGRWKDYEKEHLEQRGFILDIKECTDTKLKTYTTFDIRNLNENHWQIIQTTFRKMMYYLTEIVENIYFKNTIERHSPDEIFYFTELPEQIDTALNLIRKEDIPQIFWRNLEKISNFIDKTVTQITSSPQYDGQKAQPREKNGNMSDEEYVRLKYLLVKRASESGLPALIQNKNLGESALESWREYWLLTFEQKAISETHICEAIDILYELHFSGHYKKPPFFPWDSNNLVNRRINLIETIRTKNSLHTAKDIDSALLIGKNVYNLLLVPWEVPLELFFIQLPIIDPANIATYHENGKKALWAVKLADYWYNFLDGQEPSKWINRYEWILNNGIENFLRGGK